MATVLIIEDHAMSRQVLHILLEHMGHRVLEAVDGNTALALARSEHPDLIISDILLPGIDGLKLVQQLRAETLPRQTPVIFYTATCRLPEDLRLDKACENCRVIPKPSDPEVIIQVINEMLGLVPDYTAQRWERRFAAFNSFSSPGARLQLAVLMDLSYSMVAQRNPKRLLHRFTRAVAEIVNCRRCLLAIGKREKTCYYLSDQGSSHSCPGDLLPPAEILNRVVGERTPVRWAKAAGVTDTVRNGGRPHCETRLLVPFASPESVYGWLCLIDKLGAVDFTGEDEEMTTTLCTEVALAYENILLLEQLRHSEEHLEELVKKRTAELERVHAELLKIQKLESLGVLAGGIAHDFNNALTSIVNNIQIAKMKMNPGDQAYRNLNQAEKACYDVQSLTRQLLTFAKGGSPVKTAARLTDLVRDTAEFTLRGTPVKCEFALAPDLSVVEIDQGQISQVVGNLVINAVQAMPGGGIIRIAAENIVLGTDGVLPLKEGRYVKFSVFDQGEGIDSENLDKIFDPYFTTKQKGSGLGLASAFSIIKKHDGYISVESEKGKGTAFHVYLPATDKKIERPQKKKEIPVTGGRILLIEDQRNVAESLNELLGYYGFFVDHTGDGDAGLELYQKARQEGSPYQAVIMDLTIPGGMGGKETIKRLRELDAHVPVIVASGYSNDPVMSDYRSYGFNSAITKPYHIDQIIDELQKCISRS